MRYVPLPYGEGGEAGCGLGTVLGEAGSGPCLLRQSLCRRARGMREQRLAGGTAENRGNFRVAVADGIGS